MINKALNIILKIIGIMLIIVTLMLLLIGEFIIGIIIAVIGVFCLKASNTKKTKQKDIKNTPKQQKKKSIRKLSYPTDFTIIDFETTGFSFTSDEIIEIGAIKVRNLEIIDSFSTFCNPYMEILNTDFHGITDNDVKDYDYPIKYIYDLLDFIEDDIICAYNAPFDITFLNSYLNKNIDNKILDILNLAKLNDSRDSFKLENIKKELNINEISHRAIKDCETTLKYYNYLAKNKKLNNIQYMNYKSDMYTIRTQKHSKMAKIILKSYIPDLVDIDTNNYFYNKNICFTGIFDSLPRYEAFKRIMDLGGRPQERLTLKTNCLVIGQYKHITNSEITANKYNEERNLNIDIIDEKQFLKLLAQ